MFREKYELFFNYETVRKKAHIEMSISSSVNKLRIAINYHTLHHNGVKCVMSFYDFAFSQIVCIRINKLVINQLMHQIWLFFQLCAVVSFDVRLLILITIPKTDV